MAPALVAVPKMRCVTVHISTWNFRVCRFFLPLYQRRCFFWVARTGLQKHRPRRCCTPFAFPGTRAFWASGTAHWRSARLPPVPPCDARWLHGRPSRPPGARRCGTHAIQGHQELFSYAERGWAAGFLPPCFSCGQHRFHLREGFGIHPGAAAELLAVHLQRAGQAIVLHLFSLTRDFRKTSNKPGTRTVRLIGIPRTLSKRGSFSPFQSPSCTRPFSPVGGIKIRS